MTAAPVSEEDDHFERWFAEICRFDGAELAKRTAAGYFVDIGDFTSLQELPGYRKLLLMVFVLALRDGADELRFDPYETKAREACLRMSYVFKGVSYELVPPPYFLFPLIILELKILAGWFSARAWIGEMFRKVAARIHHRPVRPFSGKFRIGGGGHGCEVSVTLHPGTPAESIFLAFTSVDPGLSQQADSSLRRFLALRRESGRGEEVA